VNEDDDQYEAFSKWGVERLMKVSIPCETAMAKHYRKKLFYPYLDPAVLDEVGKLDPEELRPRSLEDRKSVLKTTATELGYPILAHRTKKASQYGSSTTDLIRGAASRKGVRYNRFISDIYESLGLRNANLLRDAVVDVRMDPILVHDAEEVLGRIGITHSEAMAEFYRRMVLEGNLDFLKK
jgi:asparagine synthase (glutamine-hydrolysing)